MANAKATKKGKAFNFTFQKDLHYRALKMSEKRGMSLSGFINTSVSEKLDREERESGIQRQAA